KYTKYLIARDSLECLIMIDGLQRLVIDYHFEEEIEVILGRINKSIAESDGIYDDNDLYYVSLRFRLLRQNGYHPSADVFNKFKDENETFKLSLREDLRGIMELFEASEFCTEGEIILDEAFVFASKHLNDVLKHVGEDEARVIRDTLNHPYNKSFVRFKAKPYIKNFERDYGTNDILQELVKVDFNIVQTLHQKELLEVSMGWKDLGLTQELKFARNQQVKWYLWSIAALSDPRYSKERIELKKPISLIYIMDDIFYVHRTFDELVLFTEAINMWDLSALEKLPYYMKVFYKVIYDITDDISSKVFEEHGYNPSDSLQKAALGGVFRLPNGIPIVAINRPVLEDVGIGCVETKAICEGFRVANRLGFESLCVRADSEFAVKVLNGDYKHPWSCITDLRDVKNVISRMDDCLIINKKREGNCCRLHHFRDGYS
ncbi:hypothetical protein GIB67_041247, partial [Kingdonia uniflora]